MDYLKGFTVYLSLVTDNPVLIALIIFVILVALVIYFLIKRHKPKQGNRETTQDKKDEVPAVPTVQIGQGKFKCAVIRDPTKLHRAKGTNIIDFTLITEPVGECHFGEPSCYFKGDIYTVKELSDGRITDYEEARNTAIDTEKRPEMAYWAIVWKEMKDAIGAPVSWLKNMNIWLVVGCLVVLLFIAMAALDIGH